MNSNIKLYLLLIGIMVIGLFVWRFSITLFSRFNKSSDRILINQHMKKMEKKVIIVGAGLVGSLWAVYMAKAGYKVTIYERRPDIRKAKSLLENQSI